MLWMVFTQAHVISQNAAKLVHAEVGQKVETLLLIRTQGYAESLRHRRTFIQTGQFHALGDVLPGTWINDVLTIFTGQLTPMQTVHLVSVLIEINAELIHQSLLLFSQLQFHATP